MSRKNFKVATAENGQTTIVKIDKTTTGKVKTIKDKEEIKKEREEQYKNFRVGALKRRAKRMKLSEEETEKAIKALLEQLDTPNSYTILITFNQADQAMLKEALKNEDLMCKIMTDTYCFLDGDKEVLDTIRGFNIPTVKIYPYVKKKPAILPASPPTAKKKPLRSKKEKKAAAIKAKKERKANNKTAHANHKKHSELHKAEKNKKARKLAKAEKLFKKHLENLKKAKAKTVQMKNKKPSESLKKASTTMIPRRRMNKAA